MKRVMTVVLALWCGDLIADPPTPDIAARFVAGMPLEGTTLQGFELSPAWKEHATKLDEAWASAEGRQLAKVRAWSGTALGANYASPLPVFYLFSGPDILYAQAVYPNAGTYVLCAREPIGGIADPASIPPAELGASLEVFRRSLDTVLSFNYFITKDMKVDFNQKHFPGVLPVLEAFLVRSGGRILSVTPVCCSHDGAVDLEPRKRRGVEGVRIRFSVRVDRVQTLYYFVTDLSNGGIATEPGVLRFCEKLGHGQSILKSASYLLHEEDFSRARNWLLEQSRWIVQEPSGIPFQSYDPAKWRVEFWGRYSDPIPLFAKYREEDLAKAASAGDRPALSFGFGYQVNPARTLIMVAVRNAQ